MVKNKTNFKLYFINIFLLLIFIFNINLNADKINQKENKILSIMLWNVQNKNKIPLIAFNEKKVNEILNINVDLIILNNVKNLKSINFFKHNKKILTYNDGFKNYLTSVFLLNKNIKEYKLLRYSILDNKNFENEPLGIEFIKNNKKIIVLNIKIEKKSLQDTFIEINKMERLIKYYNLVEGVDKKNIIITGYFNISSLYTKKALFDEIKVSNVSKSYISKNNKLENDYQNFLINKKRKYITENYEEYKKRKKEFFNLFEYKLNVNAYLPIFLYTDI